MLYASDFDAQKNAVAFENTIINSEDDENLKKKAVKLYENASTVEELFAVWSETYEQKTCPQSTIFGEETVAYDIGHPPLRKRDLREFKNQDEVKGMVNRFEEILRHNNVSDKENAFSRLIALFICKLVDEAGKDEAAEVEFQYKIGTDDYETLQDRLQRLHRGRHEGLYERNGDLRGG